MIMKVVLVVIIIKIIIIIIIIIITIIIIIRWREKTELTHALLTTRPRNYSWWK